MSARQPFDKATLKDSIQKQHDAKMAKGHADLADDSDVHMSEQDVQWFESELARLKQFVADPSVTPEMLSKYRIKKRPEKMSRYERSRLEDELKEGWPELLQKRLDRVDAMKADKDGNVYLTANMLRDYFGL